jgi:hypothetical protein
VRTRKRRAEYYVGVSAGRHKPILAGQVVPPAGFENAVPVPHPVNITAVQGPGEVPLPVSPRTPDGVGSPILYGSGVFG